MSHITLRNIHGSNAPRRPEYCKGDNSYYFFSFVWVDGDIDIDHLVVDGLYRDEPIGCVEAFKICKGAKIHTLSMMNVLHQNRTGKPLPLLLNEGEIDCLYMYNVDAGEDEKLTGNGKIGKITEI